MNELNINEDLQHENNKPLSFGTYLGYLILFCIPIVNLIVLLVFSFSNGNINRKNLARAYLTLIAIIFCITYAKVVISGIFVYNSVSDSLMSDDVMDSMESLANDMMNSTLKSYTGNKIRGSTVKQLIEYVEDCKSNDLLQKDFLLKGDTEQIENNLFYSVTAEYDSNNVKIEAMLIEKVN